MSVGYLHKIIPSPGLYRSPASPTVVLVCPFHRLYRRCE